MKQKPKSCGCSTCRRGKGTASGKFQMKCDERKFRHNAKIALNKGKEMIGIAPYGQYTD